MLLKYDSIGLYYNTLMTQTDSYTPESTNTPISHNGKGDLYDALDAMDVAPEVQDQIDATESISERIL